MSSAPKNCLIVFAKTPGLTPLKTRLAAEVGQSKAEAIYVAALDCLQHSLEQFSKKQKDYAIYWALAEKSGPAHPFWLPYYGRKVWTGTGPLGERLARVSNIFAQKYQRIILTGADCPQMNQSILSKATKLLETNKYVAGPAADGGYYLFGAAQKISAKVWQSVPYSASSTLAEFKKLLPEKTKDLSPLTDIDYYQDLKLALEQLEQSGETAAVFKRMQKIIRSCL